MNHLRIAGLSLAMTLFGSGAWAEETEEVDASDPTKIYSYAGPGYKFTEYSNGDSLSELRAIGNIGFSDNDMLLFEIGYGKYSGTIEGGEKRDGVTNGRLRYFHLFKMDYSIAKGYRGWATQVDLQFEGKVKVHSAVCHPLIPKSAFQPTQRHIVKESVTK